MNEIDRIKLDVINNELSYIELMELYIKYLKIRQSMMNKIPSIRNDYKYYVNDIGSNCYAYAFRFDLPLYFATSFDRELGDAFDFYPGCFCGIHNIYTSEDLLNGLYGDLDILGIKYSDKLDDNHLYKVAVFFESEFLGINNIPDFHFWRLNGNGMWSCKNGYSTNIEKSDKPRSGMSYRLIKVLDINR